MDEQDDPKEEPLPQSSLEVLERAAKKISQLELIATEALSRAETPENAALCKEMYRQKARTLADLPTKMARLQERGIPVPDEIADWCNAYSSSAKDLLARQNTFGMNFLLIPKGLQVGEPNSLERFITELKTPASPDLDPTTKPQ